MQSPEPVRMTIVKHMPAHSDMVAHTCMAILMVMSTG